MNVAIILFVIQPLLAVAAYYNTYKSFTAIPGDIPASETTVDLGGNLISDINGEFDHLTKLEVLYLNGNKFAEFPDLGLSARTVTSISLKGNEIASVDGNRLVNLDSLIQLDLTHNAIEVFPNLTAVGDTLTVLNLEDNGMMHIPNSYLNALTSLVLLTMGINKITEIPAVTGPENSLLTLDIHGNSFTALPKMNLGKSLHNLILYDNPNLTVVEPEHLEQLQSIMMIDLSGTGLTYLPDLSPIAETLAIAYLSISFRATPIQTVSERALASLGGIGEVMLESTKITHLPFTCFDKKVRVTLTGSPLDVCACNMIWLQYANEHGNTLIVSDVICPEASKSWTQMSYKELGDRCQAQSTPEQNVDACAKGKYCQQ